ncbi:hypothetical protein CLG85_015055 [Yangia mangrovi]|uniref:Uncharacterized protein n=1 Tax=Alloyangia mangrovi TaxID=1779329 RepID=A0ABT2KLE3_9RHOB|nr:hypothetical protein [Alloyangia mangrovi]MCT4371565.1 hypothetical protein [Alloyangia mangrovi]
MFAHGFRSAADLHVDRRFDRSVIVVISMLESIVAFSQALYTVRKPIQHTNRPVDNSVGPITVI